MINLTVQQINTLQSLQAAGSAAGQYSDAYRYLSEIAQTHGTDPTVATWLDRAASINGKK